jgi:hypothetical protein
LIEVDADVALEIGEAEAEQPSRQRHDPRAEDDAEDSEQRSVRQIGG